MAALLASAVVALLLAAATQHGAHAQQAWNQLVSAASGAGAQPRLTAASPVPAGMSFSAFVEAIVRAPAAPATPVPLPTAAGGTIPVFQTNYTQTATPAAGATATTTSASTMATPTAPPARDGVATERPQTPAAPAAAAGGGGSVTAPSADNGVRFTARAEPRLQLPEGLAPSIASAYATMRGNTPTFSGPSAVPPADYIPNTHPAKQKRAWADALPAAFAPAPPSRAVPDAHRFTVDAKTGAFPPLQPVAGSTTDAVTAERRDKVRGMAKHAWDSYEKWCFGKDELIPPRQGCKDWMGAGLTIVDSLSTLWLMNMTAEFTRGRDWVAQHLVFDQYPRRVSFFETTIRIVGGLLSAFDMSGDRVFVDKAVDVGHRLLGAWGRQPAGVPLPAGLVDMRNGDTGMQSWAGGYILAEIGTVQTEYFTLSRVTGDPSFHTLAHGVYDALQQTPKPVPGLYPVFVATGAPMRFSGSKVTLGGLSDSFYEYELKMWLLSGKQHAQYRDMYVESAEALYGHLFAEVNGVGYVGEHPTGYQGGERMEHLACFASGMYALGVHTDAVTDPEMRARHLHVAKKIAEGCVLSYVTTATGLGPESFIVGKQGISINDPQYHLRPETAESLFLLWRTTKDPIYREWGWLLVDAIERNCRHANGYVNMANVGRRGATGESMETFVLAETFKYLFLLFSEDAALDLDQWVFNTEAHPVRVREWLQPGDVAAEIARVNARAGNMVYDGPYKKSK